MDLRDSFFARPGDLRLLGLVAGAVGLALGAAVPAVHAGLDVDGRQRAGARLAVVVGTGTHVTVDALMTGSFVLHVF